MIGQDSKCKGLLMNLTKSIASILLGAAVLAAAPGCQNSKPTKTNKQLASRQWNDARANVLGSLALEQYKGGNLDKCETTLSEALRLAPENANLHVLAAKLYIEQNKLEPAAKELETARKLDPKNAEPDYLTGVVLQRWQQPQKALEAYDAAVQKNREELSYLMAKAETLVALNRPSEALDLLKQKVVYFEHSPAIRDAVGQLLVEQRRYREGAEMLREASILATDDQTIREHLGFAEFFARQYNEASQIFVRLLRDEAFSKRADLHAALAECQAQTGRLRDARASFETAAQLDATGAGYWLGLGRVAVQLGDLPRGELAARKALSIEPANGEGHCLLGYVRLRQGKLAPALAAFRMASQLDSGDSVSLAMQGYVLEKLGKNDQAVQCYAKALKIKPNDELASRLMAAVNVTE